MVNELIRLQTTETILNHTGKFVKFGMTTLELVLWGIGIVIAIVLAFYGVKKVRSSTQYKRRRSAYVVFAAGFLLRSRRCVGALLRSDESTRRELVSDSIASARRSKRRDEVFREPEVKIFRRCS